MDYMREYEKWLASPALTPEEHAELESIRGDEKEIRERFYGHETPLIGRQSPPTVQSVPVAGFAPLLL